MNSAKEQLNIWESKRSEINIQYRSARTTFIYYLIGISIAILGYLVNTVTIEHLEYNTYKVSLISFGVCVMFGFANIIIDYKMKFNDYARGECLIKQNKVRFEKYVSTYKTLHHIEYWSHITTILALVLGLLFSLLWKLSALNIISI